jgi:urea transporter
VHPPTWVCVISSEALSLIPIDWVNSMPGDHDGPAMAPISPNNFLHGVSYTSAEVLVA